MSVNLPLTLHGGQQENVFQELDALLSQVGDRKKQRDMLAKLENDVVKALKNSASGLREAEAKAWCEDLKQGFDPDNFDSKKLFAELDSLACHAKPTSPVAEARVGDFQREVQGLLQRVASESELLARQFPVFDEEPLPEIAPLRLDPDSEEEKESPPTEPPDPKVFDELGPFLDANKEELLSSHRKTAAEIAMRMTAFVSGVQRVHADAHVHVDRLLRGEGSDAHPVDQEHAAWRRSTLQSLHYRGAAPPGGRQHRKSTRRMSSMPATRGASGLQRSASLTFAQPPWGMTLPPPRPSISSGGLNRRQSTAVPRRM